MLQLKRAPRQPRHMSQGGQAWSSAAMNLDSTKYGEYWGELGEFHSVFMVDVLN